MPVFSFAALALAGVVAASPAPLTKTPPVSGDAVDQVFAPWVNGDTPGCAVAASRRG
jgi:hypothetical protein